ncbi:VIT1/CCC1 family predicted Fe2+/Mn2+ transporter [Xanthomonas sacchari]|uniref:VIT1/CCC1 transporter family protein n=1 Tax=Xanthomonas sacchari TaxID=56458 RepID=UPI0027860924|nr:VIT family protein [Xanthomonas sacchari]MDQ1092005.1 VIT1/CCC1 family predicted Fe2+/Mn2+ transporter [Xanthomonas sacchari]
MRPPHSERHRTDRAGWLRAAVLGANDGILSVAGLVVGVASSGAAAATVLTTGIAGLVAGAMSMAAGEYVSVQSQADIEHADLALERRELHEDPQSELDELTAIYRQRGLDPGLARQVAEQLTAHDALGAHARDELGITESLRARPLRAAAASAAAFCSGAALPIVAAWLAPAGRQLWVTGTATLIGLSLTGALAARAGGASGLRGAVRVVFWGAAAMLASGAIGHAFGVHV